MRLALALHSTYTLSPEEQRADVERQAKEWAAAEPKVTGCRIVSVEKPSAGAWCVTVDLSFVQDQQPTLGGAA